MNSTIVRATGFFLRRTFLAGACGLLLTHGARAVTIDTLHSFTAGAAPAAPLIEGSNHVFYGTTTGSGAFGFGSIYTITGAGDFTTLFSFNHTNGALPYAPLFSPNNGYLYGTASSGGSQNLGVVFRITPAGAFTGLLSFNATNGAAPRGGLALGTDGQLYGTTVLGGANSVNHGPNTGYGTVFTMTAAGKLTNLVSFDGASAANPYAGLVRGQDGNFYGTTQYGGSSGGTNGFGTVFVMGLNGALTNLVVFNGNNGAFPKGLTLSKDGKLYGVTISGGPDFLGTFFQVTTNGTLTQLLAFDGVHGAYPNANLVQADDGTFYGTTEIGGDYGMGTIFVYNEVNGGATLFSFDGGVNGSYPQAGLMQAADGNLYGTTSGGGSGHGGVVYQLGNFAPFILTQPKSRTTVNGGTATFSVKSGGSTTLIYQWMKNGADLSDDGHYAGTATTNLTVLNVTAADAGSYTVEVHNDAGYMLSQAAILTVTMDRTIPTVTISTPTVNARTTNALLTGTAGDSSQVTRVIYWITNINNGITTISATNDATVVVTNSTRATWSAMADLLPGTNILSVRSVDFSTNFSAVVTRHFFYRVQTPFTLMTNGDGAGTLTGVAAVAGQPLPTNGALLDIGAGYSITAKADARSFFTNWTGSVGTVTNTTLHFVMEPGVTVQANFVTNLFLRMVGTYNGLFSVGTGVTEETAGMVSGMTVSSLGVYAGRVLLNGASYALSGKFNMGGSATNVIARTAAKGGPGTVAMYLGWNNSPRQVIGMVSGTNVGGWSADMVLIAATTNKTSGEFTMRVPSSGVPAGDGYGLFTNKAGVVTVSGKLSDGTVFTQTASMSEIGTMPLYASLYANTGLLTGWLNFDNGSNTMPAGTLTWIKKTARTPSFYTNGFTNVITVQGSTWTMPPRGVATLPYPTSAPAALDISGGNLATDLSFNIGVTTNNALVKVGGATNSLTGTIDPKTGLLTVTFGNGKGRATTIGYGAVLQNATSATGYFLGTNVSGGISLHP